MEGSSNLTNVNPEEFSRFHCKVCDNAFDPDAKYLIGTCDVFVYVSECWHYNHPLVFIPYPFLKMLYFEIYMCLP